MATSSPEKTERWIDLSAYGMAVKEVVLPSKNSILLLTGGDDHADALKELGYERRQNGTWIRKDADLNPRNYQKRFPLMKMAYMPLSQIVEYIEKPSATQPADIVQEDLPVEKLIGINRNEMNVFEDEHGVRYVNQQYGKRLLETDHSSYQPPQFLRSPEPSMLIGCADGFLFTRAKFAAEPFAEVATFAKAAGAPDVDTFKEAVHAAVAKNIIKDKAQRLEDRYLQALEYRKLLAGLDIPHLDNTTLLMVARRLMGMDKDLIGESVACQGDHSGLFGRLLPERGVATAERPFDATVLIDFPSSSKQAAETMLNRKPGGMTVSVIAAKTPNKAHKILEQLAQIVDIDIALFVGEEAGGPRLIVVSQVVPEPRKTYELREFASASELWTFASVSVTTRSHAIEAVKSGLSDTSDLTAAAAYISQNALQIPYASASKTAEPTLHVPKELKDSTNRALDRLMSTVGDVDQFVANEFGFPVKKLGEFFSPEQVDALGLAVLNERRGRATLNADGAGAGKGRWVMGLVKKAIKQGKKVILLTEAVTNLADLMRDAKHLGMLDMLKPVVMNDGAKLIDEATGLPFDMMPDELLDEAIANGEWPRGVNAVLGSYSQLNRGSDHERAVWLEAVVDENTVILGDEIHNAASLTSNTSRNVGAAIDKAGSVFMSSATHAHSTQMVAFYNRLLPPGIDRDEVRAMMIRGGENFQEVLTSMLVADGVMVRRELDVTDREFKQSVDFTNMDRNKALMDQAAVIISEMTALSGSLDKVVEEHNANEDNRRDGLEMKKMGIGASLHHMIRLFDAALMAKTVGEAAVQTLKDGGKPVILVDNTIHALLEEAVAFHGGRAPDFKDVFTRVLKQIGKVSIVRNKSDDAEGPTATSIVMENGEVLMLPPVVDQDALDEAEVEAEFEGDAQAIEPGTDLVADRRRLDLVEEHPAFNSDIARIQMLIEQFPDMPASAIDIAKNTIKDAGYTCGEITGRQLEVGQDGLVIPRQDRDRMVVKNGFNSGQYDGLIINSAGTTGSDLHASERFADQRRRHFHVLQAPDKINKEIQSYGRVSRRGAVVNALIHFHSSGLPYKIRLDSMRNNKLRFTSATVTGDRQTNLLMEGIPDLINTVGDRVVWNYAQKRPDLVEKLHLTAKFFPESDNGGERAVEVLAEQLAEGKENETNYEREKREEKQMRIDAIRRNSHLANDFLSRLALLPVAYQEKVLRELGSEYELAIEEMNAKGENPLRPREISGVVHVVKQRLFEGSEDTVIETAFDGPLHLVDVDIERVADPITADQVIDMIDSSVGDHNECLKMIKEAMKHRETYLRPYLPRNAASVEDAVLAGNATVINMVNNMYDLHEAIEGMKPGRQIDFVMPDGEKVKAIVTKITGYPGFEHLASSYSVTLAVPGEIQFIRHSMTSLIREQPIFERDENKKTIRFLSEPGLEGADYEKILLSFDQATGRRRVPAKILTTNLYSAVRVAAQFNIGQLVSYVDVDGKRQRGVLISKSAEKKLEKASIRVEGKKAIRYALVDVSVELNSSPYGTKNSVIITPLTKTSFHVRVPEPKKVGGVVKWPSAAYRDLFERVQKVDKLERVVVQSIDDLDNVLSILAEAGVIKSMYASAKHRDRLKAFDEDQQPEMKMAGGMR